jgi:hypothetical protein
MALSCTVVGILLMCVPVIGWLLAIVIVPTELGTVGRPPSERNENLLADPHHAVTRSEPMASMTLLTRVSRAKGF